MKVHLYFIGKPKDTHANAMAEDFMTRTARYTKAEMREIRPDRVDPWEKHPGARMLLLDPAGREIDSTRFADFVRDAEMHGRDLVFVIGGHDGLPPEWRTRGELISLSRLTMPHELARVMVAEQVYRALAALRGHPYPR